MGCAKQRRARDIKIKKGRDGMKAGKKSERIMLREADKEKRFEMEEFQGKTGGSSLNGFLVVVKMDFFPP